MMNDDFIFYGSPRRDRSECARQASTWSLYVSIPNKVCRKNNMNWYLEQRD